MTWDVSERQSYSVPSRNIMCKFSKFILNYYMSYALARIAPLTFTK